MNRLLAKIVLVTSCLVLAVTAVMLLSASDEEPRADLVGRAVTSTTSTTSTPPTPPTLPVAAVGSTTTTTAPDPGVVPQRLQIPSLGVD
ncbi:MAG TPA: hypothetical protein VMW08_07650, partial [Acidimicrobiales bacterium]|nr:hypothetical protein [Acidimicrobiales bacterium]